MRPDGCDCYTSASGYWELGPNCRAAELEEWRKTLSRMPHVLEMLAGADKKRGPKFRTVNGKIRLIEDVELPED